MLPYLKGFENGEQFLVMDIVVEFGQGKGAGMEGNGVDSLSIGETMERMVARA